MKKVICCLLAIVTVLVVFTACGEKRPENIGDEYYEYGCKALDIIDQYLDKTIDAKTASDRLFNLKTVVGDRLPETEFGDPTHRNDFNIKSAVSSAYFELWEIDFGTGSQDDLKEDRAELAALLGKR